AANFAWFHLAGLLGSNTAPFTDSYWSAFGNNYRNFVVDNPDQNLKQVDLKSVIDVGLYPFPYSSVTASGIEGQHAYAPAWYAGSATAPGYSENPKVGLSW